MNTVNFYWSRVNLENSPASFLESGSIDKKYLNKCYYKLHKIIAYLSDKTSRIWFSKIPASHKLGHQQKISWSTAEDLA